MIPTSVLLFVFHWIAATNAVTCHAERTDLSDGAVEFRYPPSRTISARSCDLLIGGQPDMFTVLTVKSLNVPSSPTCSEGSLSASSPTDERLAVFCGRSTPFTEVFKYESVRLIFEINPSAQDAGFVIQVESKSPDDITTETTPIIQPTATTETMEATSEVTQETVTPAANQGTRMSQATEPTCNNARYPVFVPVRIFGGTKTPRGSWPWMASLKIEGATHFCAASLINEHWLVTAAHCFQGTMNDVGRPIDHLSEITVRLGAYILWKKPETERDYAIEKVVVHPEYDRNVRFNNDIALIKLKSTVETSDSICPIVLTEPEEELPNETTVYIAGWGTASANESRDPMKGLFSALLRVVGQTTCRTIHKELLTDNMICAGGVIGVDACQGDSGGPLIKINPKVGTRVLVGVVSWGKGCGEANSPGVYTRLANYIDWIHSTIQQGIVR